MNENCGEAYYNKGCLQENFGKSEEANKNYEKAFELIPEVLQKLEKMK